MFRRVMLLRALFTIAFLSLSYAVAPGQTVSYSGVITNNGLPVNNGFVIVGTFKPSFNPLNGTQFENEYSYDGAGNYCTCDSKYSRGVSDGTFTPLSGSGTTTTFGSFSGSGLNFAGAGKQLWLWAFDSPNPDTATTLALATSASWVTGSDPLVITTSQASSFSWGSKNGTAIALAFHVDVPESTCCTFVALIIPLLGIRRGSGVASV